MRRVKRTAREAKTHRSSKDITYAIKRVRVAGAQRREMEKLSPVPFDPSVPESSACSGS